MAESNELIGRGIDAGKETIQLEPNLFVFVKEEGVKRLRELGITDDITRDGKFNPEYGHLPVGFVDEYEYREYGAGYNSKEYGREYFVFTADEYNADPSAIRTKCKRYYPDIIAYSPESTDGFRRESQRRIYDKGVRIKATNRSLAQLIGESEIHRPNNYTISMHCEDGQTEDSKKNDQNEIPDLKPVIARRIQKEHEKKQEFLATLLDSGNYGAIMVYERDENKKIRLFDYNWEEYEEGFDPDLFSEKYQDIVRQALDNPDSPQYL